MSNEVAHEHLLRKAQVEEASTVTPENGGCFNFPEYLCL